MKGPCCHSKIQELCYDQAAFDRQGLELIQNQPPGQPYRKVGNQLVRLVVGLPNKFVVCWNPLAN